MFWYHFSLPNTDSDTWNSCMLTNPVWMLCCGCAWSLLFMDIGHLCSKKSVQSHTGVSTILFIGMLRMPPIQHFRQYGRHFQYWYRHCNNTKNNRSDISYNTSQWHLLKVTLLKAQTFCMLFKEKSLLFKLWKAPHIDCYHRLSKGYSWWVDWTPCVNLVFNSISLDNTQADRKGRWELEGLGHMT